MFREKTNQDLPERCKYIGELIQASIDGEITETEKAELGSHLKECQACSQAFELAKQTRETLVTNIVEEELPPYFEAKFWQRVENEARPVRFFAPRRLVPRLAGVMAIAIGALILFHGPRAPAPEIHVISPEPQHVVSGDDAIISAAFYPQPKGGSVSLLLNGKILTPQAEIENEYIMYDSEEDLPEGHYRVKVQVKDNRGKVQSEKEWVFYVLQ